MDRLKKENAFFGELTFCGAYTELISIGCKKKTALLTF